MSAQKGDWEIDLGAALVAAVALAGFAALVVYLICS